MALTVHTLESGWQFKETDGKRVETWLPVAKVPTNVHLDLMANKMSVPCSTF
jgi:beta-mannosidase